MLLAKQRWSLLLILMISTFCIVACNKNQRNSDRILSLDMRYTDIDKIYSKANCIGPNGAYITEVNSDKNGALRFTQTFELRDLPFAANLVSKDIGYVIDTNDKTIDTLSSVAIEMIRSHDFHRMHTNPDAFFQQIEFEQNLSDEIEVYVGIDQLNHPAKIYYDKSLKNIRSIELLNMIDTSEVININYTSWIDSDFGKLAKTLHVIQAQKDTFNFDFEVIEINKND